jgi:DNA-binding CsgD family transcriptional regulator
LVGDKRILAAALHQRVRSALATADLPVAIASCLESLELSVELDDRRGITRALESFANVLAAAGRREGAVELCDRADALLASLDAHRSPADQARFDELRARLQEAVGPAFPTEVAPSAAELELDRVVRRVLALLDASAEQSPHQPTNVKSDAHPLSHREREVAVLVARGLTNRAIAEALVISERTADSHVSHILEKLGVETRAQIAAWWVEHRLTRT